MRIAELSRESRVPVPTIKYYLREGLLHPGERTSPNQAQYDARHLRRLKLIRALIDVGGVPVAGVRELLDAIDAKGQNIHEAMGTATHATFGEPDAEMSEEQRRGMERVEELIAERGWLGDSRRARMLVANSLATLYQLGEDELTTLLPLYAETIERIAEAEVRLVTGRPTIEDAVEGAVIGTVVGEQILAGLRHLAHEHFSTVIGVVDTGPKG
ncbi:MerR family transcriptional regulator [Actinorhabdospora filicis]|uniref:MerR family transcriptional regulator n=1 Tax=Actinorhabdospora filicis TaxID=1785913 RepID=A0A9W6SHG2_9ACTN|nr:MerR family transcriptional regulator [Actinorhabdospora filicis]GLZ76063.1 MerR family transcriptional regulator [Actinorhabdospora filicis]